MRYTVKPEVFELNPGLHFGILIGKEMNNKVSDPIDTLRLRNAENNVRQIVKVEELRNTINVKGYRSVMEKAGINPNKYPPSVEAMLKRVIKGAPLPNINALVDLCNAVSLENQISLGGHDLRDISEDLSVGFTRGTEKFLPFGEEEFEQVGPGELVFTSGDVVQTRKWIWRQSELGKMDMNTQNVFFQLVGFGDENANSLIQALDSLEKLIVNRFGGHCQRFVVNKNNPEIEFGK